MLTSLRSINHLSNHLLSTIASLSSYDSKVTRCIKPPRGSIDRKLTPSDRILSIMVEDDWEDWATTIILLVNISSFSEFLFPSIIRVKSSSIISSLMLFRASSVASPKIFELTIGAAKGFLKKKSGWASVSWSFSRVWEFFLCCLGWGIFSFVLGLCARWA